MTDPKPPLFLIDGHSLTFKAYYAIRGLTGPRGNPTGAVFGFLRMLLKFVDEFAPPCLAVVFDTGRPTFRQELYPAYKANREAPPPDFGDQMGTIYALLAAMGIATYQLDGYEADDLLATMAAQNAAAGGDAYILSADKDLLQLVDDRITVLRPGLDAIRRCDAAAVREILGVAPGQVCDYLALVGDSSDNIPGVPGIGPKTAVTLLDQFGTLEQLLERAAEVSRPKTREALLANADRARLARQLATVAREVPFEWSCEQCRMPADPWTPETLALMHDLGFQSILKERGIGGASNAAPPAGASPLSAPAPRGIEVAATACTIMRDAAALERWVAAARDAEWLALDTETDSTDAMTAALVCISLCHRFCDCDYLPFGHAAHVAGGDQLDLETLRRILNPLFSSGRPALIGHHAKFDWKILRRHGFTLASPAFDTMIASYLLDPDRTAGHGLKQLVSEFCSIHMTPITDLIGTGRGQITFAEVPVEDAAKYAGMDADATLRLAECLRARLAAEPTIEKLNRELEIPLIEVLLDMEMGGFRVDLDRLADVAGVLRGRLSTLGREIWGLAGHPFNIGSPRQVADLLFGEIGLPTGRRGKTGYSTAEAELERLAPLHPIPKLILEHRGCEKLQSTYIEALPKMVHPRTGRIHTSFNQTIAATGRLSSTDPNLQNIPIRTELGRAIRGAFVADSSDHLLLKADYSQIELRILAHVSGDERLCAAYQQGQDVHRQTAASVFGVAPADVTGDMRAQAKVINFGIIYGMSAHGLAQQLGIGRGEAARFIERYFALYPGVQRWIDRLLEVARRTGYVETLMGRRRPVPDLAARNKMIRQGAERVAVNAPIQGTCADMIKVAMIGLHKALPAAAPGARMVCQVHDELVFSVPRDRLEAASAVVRREMDGALPLSVPVVVDLGHADNWAEC